ncbi:MAG: DUF1576 domain-containing protein [Bacillota bacterium]|nr:DUF1576 domain-containing protein [Bacillota bacterium]
MIIGSNIVERELHKEEKIKILLVFPVAFFIFGIIMEMIDNGNVIDIVSGMGNIVFSPTILLTDFIKIGGTGAAFINSAIIGFLNLYLLKKYEMRINGLLIAAFMTVLGFSFMGKNILNILPIYFGGYLYTRYQKISVRDILLVIMFSTALAPLVSEIMFSGIVSSGFGIVVGLLVGTLIGFIITPLSAHMIRFHDGFNLYNIGFTAGIIGTVFAGVLRAMNMNISPVRIVCEQNDIAMIAMLSFLFLYLMGVGFWVNKNSSTDYRNIVKYNGRTITDFTQLLGYGVTFFNMGLMGMLSLGYVLLVGGIVNGPVLAGIFTIVGFSAFGKHPKNCIPIILGVVAIAAMLGYDLSSTEMIITVLFSTTIAPIAGTYGVGIGVLAGMLHLAVVNNIGVVHGGINLYNNGFSGGIVAGFLVPIIDAFQKGGE